MLHRAAHHPFALGKAVPAWRDIHLIVDIYATHKTPEVRAWLEKHPRFKLHFTPTSASWLNLVERFFVQITSRLGGAKLKADVIASHAPNVAHQAAIGNLVSGGEQ